MVTDRINTVNIMKKVIVKSGFVGLVIRKGKLTKILNTGSHWIFSNDEYSTYDMSKPFQPTIELNVLLKNNELAQMVDVVDVNDNEIGLLYIDGNFKYVLNPGKYAYWKGIKEFKCVHVDISKIEIPDEIDKNLLNKPELLSYVRVISVDPYEKALLFIDEKYIKILDPGDYYFWKNSIKIKIAKADLRTGQMEVSGQEILTKDKAALRISFYAQFKVVDILKALLDNSEFQKQLYILMQLALREYIGTQTLDELLDNKNEISLFVMKQLDDKAQMLGVKIVDCGVKDIILPGDVKDIMNHVLIAQKKAQANIITRREETASTRSLLNTAKLMEENEMLFKLKEMEYVEKIADKINTISVSGGKLVVEQLKEIFVPGK